MASEHPRVFISYSHDSPEHRHANSTEGRGEGTRALFRLPFSASLLAGIPRALPIPLKSPGIRKGEVFTLGLKAKNVEAGHRQFPHLESKSPTAPVSLGSSWLSKQK
jgi:hypothetical protein